MDGPTDVSDRGQWKQLSGRILCGVIKRTLSGMQTVGLDTVVSSVAATSAGMKQAG